MKRSLPIIAAGVLTGCATFHPRPIDAPQVEATFRSRTLSDAGLRAYMETNLPATPPSFPPLTWDLSRLTLVAFYYHPDLAVARARVSLAEAGIVTAGGRPNPTVSFTPQFNVDAVSGVSPWILVFDLDIPIETAGKRSDRIARAERLTDAARLELAEAGWKVRSRLRAALADHLFAVRDLELLHAEERVRSESVAIMESRLAVGDVSRPDVDTVRSDLAITTLALRAAEGRVAESRARLAAALGLPGSALDGAAFAWPELDTPPTEADLSPTLLQRTGLLNRLDVRRALAEYGAVEAALQLEVARQYPDVHLGPGYEFDQGENKFSFGLSITLPVFNRNQGPIAEAEARRAEAAAQFAAREAQVIGETETALARYRAALAELAEADRGLALLEAWEKAVRRGLELGEQDRLALVAVRLQRAAAARGRFDALRRTQTALGALEDAVQRPLDAAASAPSPRGRVEGR